MKSREVGMPGRLVRGTGIRTLFRVPTVPSGGEVSRTDRLLFRPRRAVLRKEPGLLHVCYGGKVVTFEGPSLSFGQRLLRQDEFVAEQARTWSDGEAHS
jgi:hypothetical protein